MSNSIELHKILAEHDDNSDNFKCKETSICQPPGEMCKQKIIRTNFKKKFINSTIKPNLQKNLDKLSNCHARYDT